MNTQAIINQNKTMRTFKLALFLFPVTLLQAQLSHLETDFSTYKIPAKECVGVQHYSGSRIFIPENAFALESNTDSVTLYYREFYTPIDFLTNNLDLHFEDGFLESGGMFEIYVKDKDEILTINTGKNIRVEMVKEHDIRALDKWYYDEEAKAWDRNTNFSDSIDESLTWSDAQFNTDDSFILIDPDEGDAEIMYLQNQVFQTMNVSDFGMYNYDRLLKEEDAVPLIVDFKLKDKDTPIESTIYVTYEDLNTLVYYNTNDFEENFRLLPNKTFTIFTVDAKGYIAKWQQPVEFDLPALKDKFYTFEMEITEKVPASKAELEAML